MERGADRELEERDDLRLGRRRESSDGAREARRYVRVDGVGRGGQGLTERDVVPVNMAELTQDPDGEARARRVQHEPLQRRREAERALAPIAVVVGADRHGEPTEDAE